MIVEIKNLTEFASILDIGAIKELFVLFSINNTVEAMSPLPLPLCGSPDAPLSTFRLGRLPTIVSAAGDWPKNPLGAILKGLEYSKALESPYRSLGDGPETVKGPLPLLEMSNVETFAVIVGLGLLMVGLILIAGGK